MHYPTGNVFPFSYAVSNTIGQAVLFSGNEESSDWASTICAEHDTSEHVGLNVRKFMVKTIPVDFFCKELEVEPDFVKIDVEGAEDRVILGMREVLTRYKPTVFFEFGLPEGTAQLPQHFKTLREFGYTLYLSDLTQFLGSPPYSWKEIVDSSNQKLRETIFSFTDGDLLYLRPFHTNVLAIQRTQDLKLLLTDQIMPISEATHLFSPP